MGAHARLSLALMAVMLVISCGSSREPAPGSGTASTAQTATVGQMTVTFASEPDPPKSGDNSFLVTVKRPDGTPIADGDVTAVFSMPAMPSMNMPAMRSDAALKPVGGGTYRGTGQISMAGTWNVTVSVARAGQQLGNAKFSIVAK
jgi:hypothetical protein